MDSSVYKLDFISNHGIPVEENLKFTAKNLATAKLIAAYRWEASKLEHDGRVTFNSLSVFRRKVRAAGSWEPIDWKPGNKP